MAQAVVGSVAVDVVPSARRFWTEFQAQTRPGAAAVGDELGKTIADRIGAKVGPAVNEALGKGGPATKKQGEKQGEDFGGAFARTVKARIEGALKSLPKADIDADVSEAQAHIEDIREQLKSLTGEDVDVNVQDAEVLAKLAVIRTELFDLTAPEHDLHVRFDAATAIAEIDALRAIADVPIRLRLAEQGQLARDVRARVQAALTALPDVRLTADSSLVDQEIFSIREHLAELTNEKITPHLDDEATLAKIDALSARLTLLTGKSYDLRIRSNALAAATELSAVGAAVKAIDAKQLEEDAKQVDQIAKAAERSSTRMSRLKDLLILLGPAAVPLAGAVTAGLLGMGAAAGVAYLAVQAIKTEMKAGTEIGIQYSAGIGSLKDSLKALETATATGLLPGLQRAATALKLQLPGLTSEVRNLSGQLGNIGSHALIGVVDLFKALEPLLLHVGVYVEGLARRFEAWAAGPGGERFGRALASTFDQAVPILENLAGALAKLVEAFGPVGSQILNVLGGISTVLNALPVGVLQIMATAFVTLYGVGRLKGIFDSLTGSLVGLAQKATAVNSGLGTMATRVGGLVRGAAGFAILAVLAYQVGKAISDFVERNNVGAHAIDNFGKSSRSLHDALMSSKGAIDDTVRSTIQMNLENDGAFKNFTKAGIGADQLTSAVTGTEQEFGQFWVALKAGHKVSDDTLFALGLQRAAFLAQEDAAKKAAQAQVDFATAQPAQWAAMQSTTTSVGILATRYGYTTDQVAGFAAVLGISADEIKNGALTNADLAKAVDAVGQAEMSATATGSAYLDAVKQFAGSLGTAADRASFLAATLKAANGDNLSYASTMADVAVANQNVIDTFSKATDAGELLKTKLDEISGKALSSAQAQNSFESSLLGLMTGGNQALASAASQQNSAQRQLAAAHDAVNKSATGSSLQQASAQRQLAAAQDSVTKANNASAEASSKASASISGYSEAAIRNRGDLLNLVQAAEVAAEQYGSMGHSTEETRTHLIKLRDAIIAQAGSMGANTAEVAAYLNTVLKIPGSFNQAVIDLKTGMINFKDAGAQPLAAALQDLQDKALKAASATYQHELATLDGTTAAQDAYNQYVSQTAGFLVDNADKLHLTAAQAHSLAEQYFGIKNSGDVKKQIELIGGGEMVTLLASIRDTLKFIAGMQIAPKITPVLDQTAAGDVWRQLMGFATRVQVPIGPLVPVGTPPTHFPARGGLITGRGTGVSDSIHAMVSNGEFVVNARASKVYRGVLENINKGIPAFANGGYVDQLSAPMLTTLPGLPHHNDNRSVTVNQVINNPVPERASVSGPVGLRRAALALGRD